MRCSTPIAISSKRPATTISPRSKPPAALNSLFVERGADALAESAGSQTLSIMTRRGDTVAVDGRLFTVPWHGASALALILTNGLNAVGRRATELALAAAETELRNAKRETQKSAAAKADSSPRSATRSARRSTP